MFLSSRGVYVWRPHQRGPIYRRRRRSLDRRSTYRCSRRHQALITRARFSLADSLHARRTVERRRRLLRLMIYAIASR